MKLKLWYWPVFLSLVFLQPVFARNPSAILRDYAKVTYGDRLHISDEQIDQLVWVMDSAIGTPEMQTRTAPQLIHREVPRAMSRLYSLQLLRSGTKKDYQDFIAPQTAAGSPKLKLDSFNHLSGLIKGMDDESYEVLEAAVIISAVTLTPIARSKASSVLGKKLPEDSVQFLSVTAPKAGKIYTLAHHVIKRHPTALKKFEIVFLPDTHLRHMMYNEGSLAMFSTLKKYIGKGVIKQAELDLWYAHWAANIAGFRGHLAPVGSLYLNQQTYMAMNQMKLGLDKMLRDLKVNPMQIYLQKRSNWLQLNNLSKVPEERIALASLASMTRLFTPQQGKELYQSFKKLSDTDQKRWLSHVARQLEVQDEPSSTYAPAVLANSIDLAGLSESIIKVLPVLINTYEYGQKIRQAGVLKSNVPLSFRELAAPASVERILKSGKTMLVDINPDNGLASLK